MTGIDPILDVLLLKQYQTRVVVIGASLLGVVGALLAIPTAAAILMITREVFLRRQDAR